MRGKVSRDRFRFRDFDHDLDLSYITSNIVGKLEKKKTFFLRLNKNKTL